MMSAQIFGIIFILGINFLVQHKFILESLILLSFASYISFLCVYIMQPEYARLEYGLSTKNSELIESLIDSSSLTKQYQYQ